MLPKLKHNFRALKNIFFGVLLLTLSGCVMDIRDYVGVREGYFGGFRQKNEKNMTVTGGVQSVLGMSWGRLGHFFDLKTPKKHFQKCQICPKQVGMDSQATFGVYLCQRRLCDVKKYPGF